MSGVIAARIVYSMRLLRVPRKSRSSKAVSAERIALYQSGRGRSLTLRSGGFRARSRAHRLPADQSDQAAMSVPVQVMVANKVSSHGGTIDINSMLGTGDAVEPARQCVQSIWDVRARQRTPVSRRD